MPPWAYAEQRKWQYLGASKVKKGQVTLVKICIPEVGRQIWSVGLHLGAMLPCGNVATYQKDGKTEISLLHPRYMYVLFSHPAVEQALDARPEARRGAGRDAAPSQTERRVPR